jgi:hypothetical protein
MPILLVEDDHGVDTPTRGRAPDRALAVQAKVLRPQEIDRVARVTRPGRPK